MGSKGDPGMNGIDGTDGVSNWSRIEGPQITMDTQLKSSTVFCPGGSKVLGGGFSMYTVASIAGAKILYSYPNTVTGTSWTIGCYDPNPSPSHWCRAYAICASV